MRSALAGSLASLAVIAAACSPIRETHGWVADTASSAEVQPGVDTKATVLARMGSPSTTSVFDQTNWYYITTLQQNYAFYRPKTTARAITVVRFNADDVVASVDKFGIEKGRVISYSRDTTPTRGRELGVLEQIFGTLGQSSPIRTGDEEENRRNRR
jgi:outer membrane protein assembly factor BamE (lipoprotein component of BamABCDE complex)